MLKATAVYLAAIFTCFILSCNHHQDTVNRNALFQLMSSASTGITFNNHVKDTKELNIFNFRNFYNGAGVSIGDVNNDGRNDLVVSAASAVSRDMPARTPSAAMRRK